MAELKKNWALNQDAFRKFLGWLDAGVESNGKSYLEMRRRLVLYFDRKNCSAPDDLADETLNRVARKVEEKGQITDVTPAHYCYITAKFLLLEHARELAKLPQSIEALSERGLTIGSLATAPVADGRAIARERVLDCLDRCLDELAPGDRELILEYYRGERRAKIERRSALAARAGLSLNALSIKACRIRNKLEECVRECRPQG